LPHPCLIHNAHAGSVAGLGRGLVKEAESIGLPCFEVRRPGGAAAVAREALEQGYDRIIVAGGDGTISQVVNGVAPRFDRVELAVVPLGTGNDLARTLGIPLDQPGDALELALRGASCEIDLIHVTGAGTEYCVNAASGGIGARVAADIDPHDKVRWGAFAYWLTAVTKLIELKEYHVRLELDDQTHEMPLYGVIVANGMYVGGGFPIAPAASVRDGCLDVTVIPVLPVLELLAAGLNFTFGRHYADRIQSFRTRRAHLVATPGMSFSIDGEPTRTIDMTFEVLPRTLRCVVGA